MMHSADFHADEAERLLEQADALSSELSLDQPAARCRLESLIERGKLHARLAQLMAEEEL